MAKASANLDDWQDGPAPDAIGGEAWLNGNLNATKAHYAEGESVPFRSTFNNLVVGTSYTITITYDTTKAAKHGFDYLTTYNQTLPDARTEANPNPTIGTSFTETVGASTIAIPIDQNVTNGPDGSPGGTDNITQVPGVFTMWGGTLTATSPYTVAGSYSGDSDTSIQVTFTATSDTAVLAWGAHVAAQSDWGGPGTGAFNISGSPYHVAIDFNGGHQDHQMQASVVIVSNPAIALDKTHATIVDANSDGKQDAGDTVTYSYLVTNTGNVTLSNLSVHDDNGTPGNTADDFTLTIAGTLAPGATTTVSSAARVLTQADFDSGSVTNIATDQGTGGGQTVTATDTDNVPLQQSPTIALDKTHATIVDANSDGKQDAGDTVTYSYLVTNTGNVTLSNLSVHDDNGTPGNTADDFTLTIAGTLAPGATTTVSSAARVLTQADFDSGSVTNIATDQGTGGGQTVTATDTDNVPLQQSPTIALDKTHATIVDANSDGKQDAGDTVTYSYLVTNTGNVTLSNLSVHDDNGTPGNTADDFTLTIAGTLAPGATTTVSSAARVLTQADFDSGSVTNIATDQGTGGGQTVTATDTDNVPLQQSPTIALDKTHATIVDANSDGKQDAGDTVTYSYLVTNTGNVTLSNLSVHDDNGTPGNTADDFTLTIAGTLAPGATTTVSSAARVLTQADFDSGSVTNIATDQGTGGGQTVTATDTDNVPLQQSPTIALDKTHATIVDANSDGKQDAGDTVTYSYLVTNTGNVTLSNLSVHDDNGTPGNTADDFTLTIAGTLAPGATTTVSSAARVLTQADFDSGSVTNIATDQGTGGGQTVTATDTDNVPLQQSPTIALDKTHATIVDANSDGKQDAGDTVTYSYLVTNTGNVTLSNLSVHDDNGTPGNTADDFTLTIAGTLAPGATTTVSSAARVLTQADFDSGSVTNIATDQGTGGGQTVTATDTDNVPLQQSPTIALDKTHATIVDANSDGKQDAGDTVTYSYLVTNTGNVTLSNLSVHDDNGTPGNTADDFTLTIAGTLAPGATTTVSSAARVLTQADFDSGSVTNIATDQGTGGGQTVTATDTDNVPLQQSPTIALDKTHATIVDANSDGKQDAGDTVTYSYLVTNTGNVTLSNLSVHDDNGTPGNTADDFTLTIAGTLAPGATTTVSSAARVLTQADFDSGSVTNIATDQGTGGGQTVTATDTDNVPLQQSPTIALDKTHATIVDANSDGKQDAGDTVTYSYLVTNTGNVTLSNLSVHDDNGTPGNTADDFTLTIAGTLAPGATTTVSSAARVLTQADFDSGSVTNIATDQGTGGGQTVTATDTDNVPLQQSPTIALDKTHATIVDANSDGKQDAGDTVTYSYLVTNTGNVTLSNLSVHDDNGTPGNTADDFTLTIAGTLAPGATTTVSSAARVLTQADFDSGSVTNIATDQGTGGGQTVTATDTDNVPLQQSPTIALDKTHATIVDANSDGKQDAGDTVTYSYLVTNTGNVTLSNLSVHDDNGTPGNTADDFTLTIAGTLAPGATTTVSSAARVLTQADFDSGSVTNIATDQGTGGGQTVTATDTDNVPLQQSPTIALDKTHATIVDANSDGKQDAGDTVTYSYLVTNTGNVTLSNLSVHDDNGTPGNTADDFTLTIAGTLAPGATTTVSSAARVLTQADFDSGSVTNIATDQGTGGGQTVTATDTDNVPLQQSPTIDVEKLVSVDGGANFDDADTAPGPTLLTGTDPVFKFVVTNTGNVTLSNVTLHDDKFDLNGAAAGTDVSIGTLAPGGTFTIPSLTEPFQAGLQTDIATATGTPPSGPNVTDSDPANYVGVVPPIVVTGTPQFNFPNDVDKIQPKVGGGASFTFNPGGYIYWDLYSHDISKAQIKLDSGTTEYSGLAVSIVQVWGSNGIGANTGEGIYRVYVTDNTPNTSVSLDNSHLIVSYSIVNGSGQPALSTDKGIIDLVNSDPLIGNFNNFNNIENALLKASNGFTINPAGATGTAGVDKDWLSPDTTGTATGEAAKTFDALGGNDALYGRSNTQQGALVGDTLSGGAGNNLVDGRAGNDVIDMSAQSGNNYLYGGLGNDTLKGGSGNDTLVGSYGVDTLTGNGGSDVFILQRGGIEKITDFTPGTDKLWVGTFNGTATPGATFSAAGLAGAPAGTNAIYDPNGNFYFDPDGTGTGVDPILVGILTPGLNITSSDVVIDPLVQAIAGAQLSGNSGGALSNVLPTAQETPWQQHALAGSTG